jgi:Uma2 family endonuclease
MSTKTLITAEEFARIPVPEDESVRMELDEGELITMSPGGLEHGFDGSDIAGILRDYVKKSENPSHKSPQAQISPPPGPPQNSRSMHARGV